MASTKLSYSIDCQGAPMTVVSIKHSSVAPLEHRTYHTDTPGSHDLFCCCFWIFGSPVTNGCVGSGYLCVDSWIYQINNQIRKWSSFISRAKATQYIPWCGRSPFIAWGKFRTSGFNLSKPTGHVMHQQFDIQQLYVLPTLYLCVLYLSENIQRLVPLTP